jgi:hypothetical protein
MPLNKAIKDKIEEVVENFIHDELDFGFVHIDDIIDDFNFIIEYCSVKAPVYVECVKQLEKLSEDGIIDPDDKDYAISQLSS